jgi:bifunctional enzyme CysN/CysC
MPVPDIEHGVVSVSLLEPASSRARMAIVIGGHVDHGKSTIIGRLLADTGSLPVGKLEQVRARCERTARPFEYAFLLDALHDEQAQGITIDAARIFFKTAARDYLIIDAPGHVEFLKNMVTGASRAQAALLVIDAKEGIRENSRRHGYMLSMLGIRQLVVLVNKMDLVGYEQKVFGRLEADYRAFLGGLNLAPASVIPVSGRQGENIAASSEAMPWYQGPPLLEALDRFSVEPPEIDRPFRMPVQDVYKFTSKGDDRRIVAGTVESGAASVGDEVVFYPSGKKAVIKSFEAFNRVPPEAVSAGDAAGFTLSEHIFVSRGEVATLARQARPPVTTRLRASVFWLGKSPLVLKKDYLLRLGTARVAMQVEQIHRVIDASDLSSLGEKPRVERNEVAECTLRLSRAIAFDLASEVATTGRFAIVDDHEIRGGGLVREALPDAHAWVREKVLIRNYRWEPSFIPTERRALRYGQRPTLLLITGPPVTDRKALARALELHLFDEGRSVYFLGIGNVLYGVDADIARAPEYRREHMRRLAEIANLMLDAGSILIVTAIELTQEDLDLIRTTVDPSRIETVWVGDTITTDLCCDLVLTENETVDAGVERMRRMLQEKGIIFRT